ncbi:MAG: hypothetical protein U9P79_09485 [Candidatus Cloacimonadota bacterium]|nr:hypothetical protein [Candidatus Cloacimonadota bacterium]
MYLILIWKDSNKYLTAKKNEDGSIWLAESLKQANDAAGEIDGKINCDRTRVIPID